MNYGDQSTTLSVVELRFHETAFYKEASRCDVVRIPAGENKQPVQLLPTPIIWEAESGYRITGHDWDDEPIVVRRIPDTLYYASFIFLVDQEVRLLTVPVVLGDSEQANGIIDKLAKEQAEINVDALTDYYLLETNKVKENFTFYEADYFLQLMATVADKDGLIVSGNLNYWGNVESGWGKDESLTIIHAFSTGRNNQGVFVKGELSTGIQVITPPLVNDEQNKDDFTWDLAQRIIQINSQS